MTTEPAQGDPEVAVETVVYLGPSASTAGAFQWRDQGGEHLIYKKLRGRVFGGIYTIEIKRAGESSVSVYPATLRFTGQRAEDAAEIEIRAVETERRLKAKALERNAGRTATIDTAIAPLIAIATGLTTYGDRAALAQYVTARIHGS